LNDYKQYNNRKEYLLHYNEQDTIIMIESINFLINNFIKYNVDMLKQVSAASCAVQVKYSFSYRDFDIRDEYNIPKIIEPFVYILDHHCKNAKDIYIYQDKKARKHFDNNVNKDDYEIVKKYFEQDCCYICKQKFGKREDGINVIPTLDRLDSKKSLYGEFKTML
jgi:hypothetical protein